MYLHKQEQEAVANQTFRSNIIHLVLQNAVQESEAWRSPSANKLTFVLLDQLTEVSVGEKKR